MNVNITILKDIPKEQLDKFTDLVVNGIARETLDLTEGHYPRLTGDLERSSTIEGSNKTYGLGSSVEYQKYVWDYPQDTHWTNDDTYAQWYLTVYENKKEAIVDQAITGALKQI